MGTRAASGSIVGLGLVALSAVTGGCTTTSLRHLQAGGVVGTSGALGGTLEGSLGGGIVPIGIEVSARAKFTDQVISGALGAGGYIAAGQFGSVMPFLHAGMHLLQFDIIDRTAFVNAFSPYVSLGLGLCVVDCSTRDRGTMVPGVTSRSGEMSVLTFGLSAEYDVRFLRDGEGFFGLMIGFARYSQQEYRPPF